MAADSAIAEALARIEYKLDLLLSERAGIWPGMDLPSHCPVCLSKVQYQMDIINQAVRRVCGCGTGMQPPLIPFIPVAPKQGVHDAVQQSADPGPVPTDGPRR